MEKAQQIIQSYADNTTARARGPLFLYYASHAVHTPMEVPQPNLDRFLPIKELTLPGQGYAALVTVLDEAVGNLTATLRSAGLWEQSLVVFQSDNGVRQRSTLPSFVHSCHPLTSTKLFPGADLRRQLGWGAHPTPVPVGCSARDDWPGRARAVPEHLPRLWRRGVEPPAQGWKVLVSRVTIRLFSGCA